MPITSRTLDEDAHVGSDRSFYFFDIDDNLLFLPTKIYLWNAELQQEQAVTSGEFAAVQNLLGRTEPWQAWSIADTSFRDFRDDPDRPVDEQCFLTDLAAAVAAGEGWHGPSWPLLVHAAQNQRAIALVTARGHGPQTIEAGLRLLVDGGHLAAIPPILGIYAVTNSEVRQSLGADDPAMTVPSVKKLAIKHAVATALERYGADPAHRFGMSDDDPNNVVLAISAMRDCKTDYPDKRFFVINSNHQEYVKLEIFPMAHPVTESNDAPPILADQTPGSNAVSRGGNASIYVTDMDRSIQFYTETLGLELKVRVGEDWAELDAGRGLIIGLHPARPPQTVPAGTPGAINIELSVAGHLETTVETLKAAGVRFQGDILSYPAVRLATLLDPDDNPIVLAQVLDDGTGDHAP